MITAIVLISIIIILHIYLYITDPFRKIDFENRTMDGEPLQFLTREEFNSLSEEEKVGTVALVYNTTNEGD